MTPGLASFTTDGDDVRSWDDISAGVLAALATEFDVQPERHGTGALGADRRTTWLDTFDWRLYRAGLTLEYVPGRGGGELRLSGTGTAHGGHQRDAAGYRLAGIPPAPGRRPGGLRGAAPASRAAPRALLPVATASTTTRVYRLLNADGKTVARLLVIRPSLARA